MESNSLITWMVVVNGLFLAQAVTSPDRLLSLSPPAIYLTASLLYYKSHPCARTGPVHTTYHQLASFRYRSFAPAQERTPCVLSWLHLVTPAQSSHLHYVDPYYNI